MIILDHAGPIDLQPDYDPSRKGRSWADFQHTTGVRAEIELGKVLSGTALLVLYRADHPKTVAGHRASTRRSHRLSPLGDLQLSARMSV